MVQTDKILKYMETFGAITQREAYHFGCQRLASRIHDLKRAGTPIKTEMKEVTNRDGTKSRIAVYSIATEETKNG